MTAHNARITTVISTSPIPAMPDVSHIHRTIESLALVPELQNSPLIIAFDAPNDNCDLEKYEIYKRRVSNICRADRNVTFVHLDDWGHLSGVIERAIQLVQTRFVFIQQHDLPLVCSFDCDSVIRCLDEGGDVKHVRLNRRSNQAIGWDKSPLFSAFETRHISLTRTSCWSDQSHLASTDYYLNVVIPQIRGTKVFPETLLNPYRKLPIDELLSIHRRLGTFIYGPPGHPPIVMHTDARNAIVAVS